MPTERRTGSILALGALLLVATVLTVWFFDNFERRPREVTSGFSGAARNNPFLAAERFLERLGVRVQSVPGRQLLRNLPSPDDVLVANGLGPLNARRRAELHRWLSDGGQLVVEATELSALGEAVDAQGFLADYGVRVHEIDGAPSFGRITAEIGFEDRPEPLEAEFRARYFLEDAYGEASGNVVADGRDRLLQYRVGQGRLTVASDLELFTNTDIGDRDHALVLTLLAEPGEGGRVWLLYDSGVPWLGGLLWQHARYALIAAACLIGATVWFLGARLGPLLPGPEPGRRDLLVHLDAVARFHWQHGRGGNLVRMTGSRLERDWLARHPRLRGLDPRARAVWIGERAGLPAARVYDALYAEAVDGRLLITRTVVQQRLWGGSRSQRERFSVNG